MVLISPTSVDSRASLSKEREASRVTPKTAGFVELRKVNYPRDKSGLERMIYTLEFSGRDSRISYFSFFFRISHNVAVGCLVIQRCTVSNEEVIK